MSHSLVKTVAEAISASGISHIIVALSGGADSTALLRAAALSGVTVEAAHCNFHLRGDESNRDADFCRRLCLGLGLKLNYIDFDVDECLKLNPGWSVEMACRNLRYEWFRSLLSEIPESENARVAVAHNSDDNAETLMLNLLRGSGVKGLKGMDVDNGLFLRPLLGVSRKMILDYLDFIGQDFVTDSTNLESDYRRNFLRNEVFPLLRKKWPGFDKAISRSISVLAKENIIIESELNRLLSSAEASPGFLTWSVLDAFPEPQTMIFRWAQPMGISPEMAAEVAASVSRRRSPGAFWHLPATSLRVERDGLHLSPLAEDSIAPCSDDFVCSEVTMTPELFAAMKADRSNTSLWLPFPLSECNVRRTAEGDRIQPLGMKGSSLVSDIMKDAHLSATQKLATAVITDSEGKIIWVENLKRSRLHLLPPDSTTAFNIRRKNSEPIL